VSDSVPPDTSAKPARAERVPGIPGAEPAAAAEPTWQRSFRRRTEIALIAGLGYPVAAALGSTFRWRIDGFENFQRIEAAGHLPIYAFWHGRILPATIFARRPAGIAAARARCARATRRVHD
jgi:hypothetical protein